MKKALSMIMILAMLVSCMFIPGETAYAASISLSVSSASVQIGDTVTATVTVPDNISGTVDLTFPSKILTFTKASAEVNTNGETVSISMGKYGLAASKTVTVTFKAKTSGEATIQAAGIDLYDHENLVDAALGSASANITVANQTVEEPEKSGDNSLSSLKLSSGTLSPKFQYNVTKYTATVSYDIKSVVVSAKTTNEKAVIESVTGNGMVKLEVGENTIEVVVRAENGVKATYQVIVTRKAQPVEVDPQPSESTSPSESESETSSESESVITGLEDILQWNNEQLQLPADIPAENIPADFEKATIFVNGKSVQGLSFKNGDLKLLYLVNTNGAGALYVFEELQQTIYPLIKFNAENSYMFVLMPDEEEIPVPQGFVKCTLSIEGKGVITAYQLEQKEEELQEEPTSEEPATEAVVPQETSTEDTVPSETVSQEIATGEAVSENTQGQIAVPEVEVQNGPSQTDFYLMYGMNNKGETGWYLYDVVEQTFQRYLQVVHVDEQEEIEPTEELETAVPDTEDDVVTDGDAEKAAEYEKMQKELAATKKIQNVLIVACGVLGIAFLITLILFLKQNRESVTNK